MRLQVPEEARDIPPGFVFTPPSFHADSWRKRHEFKLQPPYRLQGSGIGVEVEAGRTWERRAGRRRDLMIRYFRSRPVDLSGRKVFDARFDTDRNIAHHITILSMVLTARAALPGEPEISVLLRSGATSFVRSLYQEAGVPVIETDAPVIADLVKIETSPLVSAYPWTGPTAFQSEETRKRFCYRALSRLETATRPTADMPERLFIARRGVRALRNHEEVSRLLASRGYHEAYFEDLPVGRQINLARHARSIVSIHGAALAFAGFNANGVDRPKGDLSGLKLVELFGAGYQVGMYRNMAGALNAHWCAVIGPMTSGILRDLDDRGLARAHQASPFSIDLQALEFALDYSDRASDTSRENAMAKALFPAWNPAP